METFYDIGAADDLPEELWDTDLDHPAMQEALKLSTETDMHDWFLERDVKLPPVILHDKLMTDAVLGGGLPIKHEHSYSLNSDGDSMPDSPGSLQNKMDDMDDDCYPAIPMNTAIFLNRHHQIGHSLISSAHNSCNNDTSSVASSNSDVDIDDSNIKEEPLSPGSSCPPSPNGDDYAMNVNLANMAAFTNTDLVFEHKNGSLQLSPASQSLLKNQHIVRNTTSPSQTRITIPKLNIKTEPQNSSFGLPPTPPSSLPSDESEGNQSPEHRLSPAPSTTTSLQISRRTGLCNNNSSTGNSVLSNNNSNISNSSRLYTGASSRQPIHTPLISSQPKGSTGTLVLTEEEKRTLLAEGYPIPTRLPLTKAEEKSLKKIRRKIKNKISAQESRRKKKEYMDQLERKVEILVSENSNYRKRVETLEDSNTSLLSQLAKLQSLIGRQNVKYNTK